MLPSLFPEAPAVLLALALGAGGASAQLSSQLGGQVHSSPEPLFAASPLTGAVPLSVRFTDQSLGEVSSWYWSFGDGATSTEKDPEHLYTQPGTYSVLLTVSGPGGSQTLRGDEPLRVGGCGSGNARYNSLLPLELETDFVPVTGDDSMGFYCVYSGKRTGDRTDVPDNNVGIFVFDLGGGEVLIFGSGYGDVPGPEGALFDAATDAQKLDSVMRGCMGLDPSETRIRFVGPHGHPDHLNPAIVREVSRLGYDVTAIYFHEADSHLVDLLAWSQTDRKRFVPLRGERCGQELLAFDSPLGKIWFYLRPGHTPGSIDLVLDTLGDPDNRIVVLGSAFHQACQALSGVRERIAAHGNVMLEARGPELEGITPIRGPSSGGTRVTLTGTNFLSPGDGPIQVSFDGLAVPAELVDGTTLTCTTPSGPPGRWSDVRVWNHSGSATLQGGFRYNQIPSVSSVTPATGVAFGGTRITVTGKGFHHFFPGKPTVTLGGSRASHVEVLDDTTLTCRTPLGPPGSSVALVVSNQNGTATLPLAFTYGGSMQAQRIWPQEGSAGGGTTVQIYGSGFTNGGLPTVTFGSLPASAVTLIDDTRLSCVSPPGPGNTPVSVQVTSRNGVSRLLNAFHYLPGPEVDLVTPQTGPHTGGTEVVVQGRGFSDMDAGSSEVLFGSVPASQVRVLNDTRLRCIAPPGQAGERVEVLVSNRNGTGILPAAFLYEPILVVSSVEPTSGSPVGGTPVTLIGQGFLGSGSDTSVSFGGVPATRVQVESDTLLTCLAPAGPPGERVELTLQNQLGTSHYPETFLYHAPPTVTGVAPIGGPGSGGTMVLVLGTGFERDFPGESTIYFGDHPATAVELLSDSLLRCTSPAGTPGAAVALRVQNGNGEGVLAHAFQYNPPPTIERIEPSHAPANTTITVTVHGRGFLSDSAGPPTLRFAQQEGTSVVVWSDTRITCTSPRGLLGLVDVSVETRNGLGVLRDAFEATHDPMAIERVEPNSGVAAGGSVIRILGRGFQPQKSDLTTVTLGGTPALDVQVLDEGTIECRVPRGTPDTQVPVEVRSPSGYATSLFGWRYRAEPTIQRVVPADGPVPGGQRILVEGHGFLLEEAGANQVLFAGIPATDVVVLDDTQIECTNPPGPARGLVELVVRNDNGEGRLLEGFEYRAPSPQLSSLTPSAGSSLGGTRITLSGRGFTRWGAGALRVRVDGVEATGVTVRGDTSAEAVVPAGTAGVSASVAIENDNGEVRLEGGFAYHPTPLISSVAPASGRVSGGTTITILGSGFTENAPGATLVELGGLEVPELVIHSDTRLTFTTPPASPGDADLRVWNDNGEIVRAGAFDYLAPPPALGSLEPSSGSTAAAVTVFLNGSGFQRFGASEPVVTFGALEATNVQVLDDKRLSCTAPSGPPGSHVTVVLTNSSGAASLEGAYRYHALPSLQALTPASASSLGGETLTLLGSGFSVDEAGANTLLFAGAPASELSVRSDDELTFRLPPGIPGSSPELTLQNANGSSTALGLFTYHPAPALLELSPDRGPAEGRTRVLLTGVELASNEGGSPTILFGGTPARNLRLLDDSRVECDTPPGSGSVDVVFQNANGIATLAGAYVFLGDPPSLTSLSPRQGPSTGGTLVTLVGERLAGPSGEAPAVLFNGAPASAVELTGTSRLTCLTPPGPAQVLVDVVLLNANGSSELSASFRYTAQQSLTAIQPPRGSSRGGTPHVLVGTGFAIDGEVEVWFGNEPALDVVVLDEKHISLRTPPGPASRTAEVRLRLDGTDIGTLPYTYDPTLRDLDGDGLDERVLFFEGELHVHFGESTPSLERRLIVGGPEGRPLASSFQVADLDADGHGDLILASPRSGRVVMMAGPFKHGERSLEEGRMVLPPAPAEARLGTALRVGDHDLDGMLELLVGSPGTREVHFVEPVESGAASLVLEGTVLDHDFGSALDALDADADGDLELLVGAPGSSRGGPSAGAVFGYEGPLVRSENRSGRVHLEPSWKWLGDRPGARFGSRFSLGHYTATSAHLDLAVLTGEPGRERVLLFSSALLESNPGPRAVHDTPDIRVLGRWHGPGGESLWLGGEGHGRILDLRSGEPRPATETESEGARWDSWTAPSARR